VLTFWLSGTMTASRLALATRTGRLAPRARRPDHCLLTGIGSPSTIGAPSDAS